MIDTISEKRRRVTVPGIQEPAEGLWSNCYVVGRLVVIAGMVSRGPSNELVAPGDPYAQCVNSFARMKLFMEAAGGTMNDIVKLNAYLVDIRHRIEFVKARREFFKGDFPPCVVIGGAVFADAHFLVEIDAWAILGSGQGD